MTIEIEVESLPIKPGAARGLWRVWLNGEVLVDRARDPEFAACRVLEEQGRSGPVVVRHRGSDRPTLYTTVQGGAGSSTQDSDREGVKIGEWVPFEVETEGWGSDSDLP